MSAVVAWTKRVIGAITVLAACGGDTFAQDSNPNVLTNEEKDAGFELLFNGRDLEGWEPATSGLDLKDGPWKVQDGAIYFPKESIGFPALTWRNAAPADFELRFEWKEAPMNATGLQGHVTLSTAGASVKHGWTGSLVCGCFAAGRRVCVKTVEVSVPVKFSGKSVSMAPSKDALRAPGKWNKSRLVYEGPKIQHWLNGEKVVEVNLLDGAFVDTEMEPWKSLVERWFDVRSNGLGIQIENADVPAWFRDIKLRPIPREEVAIEKE